MARAGAIVAAAIAIVPFSTYRLTIRPPTRCSRVVVCGVERAPSPAATLPLALPRRQRRASRACSPARRSRHGFLLWLLARLRRLWSALVSVEERQCETRRSSTSRHERSTNLHLVRPAVESPSRLPDLRAASGDNGRRSASTDNPSEGETPYRRDAADGRGRVRMGPSLTQFGDPSRAALRLESLTPGSLLPSLR